MAAPKADRRFQSYIKGSGPQNRLLGCVSGKLVTPLTRLGQRPTTKHRDMSELRGWQMIESIYW